MRPLRYLFRWLLLKRMQVPTETTPVLSAILVTTTLVAFNIITLIALALTLYAPQVQLVGPLPVTLSWLLPLLAVVFAIQHRLWVAGGRYKSIAREPLQESARLRYLRTVFIALYFVLSIFGLPAVGILAHHLHEAGS
jgi:hypothetical protein